MPTRTYGASQICETRFTRREIEQLVIENMILRGDSSYDFDDHRPWLLWTEQGDLILRCAQKEITRDHEPRTIRFSPIKRAEK